MQALTFPFQIDVYGHVAVATTYPEVVRGQLIDVLMTNQNERVMRPRYGANMEAALFDPTDELVRADAAQQVSERVTSFAPRVNLRGVQFSADPLQPGKLFVNVVYSAGAFDEARSLRVPVANFLSEESPV
jgi:phage baseplate assembly protein W